MDGLQDRAARALDHRDHLAFLVATRLSCFLLRPCGLRRLSSWAWLPFALLGFGRALLLAGTSLRGALLRQGAPYSATAAALALLSAFVM
jgi:hypothetical protein